MYALVLALLPVPGESAFAVNIATGEPLTGKLLRLSPEFTAVLTTRTGETHAKNVISLRSATRPIPPFPTGPQLLTTNGDRITGKFLGGEKESLRFVPTLIGDDDAAWLVPMSATAALWIVDTPADTPSDPSRYNWVEGNKNRDVVRFQNGDTTRGVFGLVPEALKPTIRFRPDVGDARDIPATEVAVVVFNPLLAKARKPKGPFARFVLSDGSRLALVNVVIADNTLKGETTFGQKVEFSVDAIVALDVFQTKATFLSDLKPSKVELSGFLGTVWPWAADRTVHGLPLRLATEVGVSTFDKGLGTHPRTVLTYDLAGKYRHFEALVGLDPERGERGRAVVRVRVDGKEQVVPGLATLSAVKPVRVRVDVSKAKELTLEVDFGPAGGVQADVNWANALLLE